MRLDLAHVLETSVPKRGIILLALRSAGGLDDALHAARIIHDFAESDQTRLKEVKLEGEALIWRRLRHDRCHLLVTLAFNRRRIR